MKRIFMFLCILSLVIASCSAPRMVKKKTLPSKQATKQETEQSAGDEGLSGLPEEEAPIMEALPGRSHLQVYVEPFNKRPKDLQSQSVNYVLQKDAPAKFGHKYPFLYTGIMLDYDGFDSDNYLSQFGYPVDDYPGDAVVKTRLSNGIVVLRIFSDQEPDENWFKISKSKPRFKEAKVNTKSKAKKKVAPKPKKKPTEPEEKEPDADENGVVDFGK